MQIKKCLTIAGSDSGGGAGIQADLKTFAALGVHGSCAIVAITAQNTKAVSAVHNVPLDIIEKQIDAVFDDIGADAVKIGMLSNSGIILLVSKLLKKYTVKNVVLDPVMVAASGAKLLEDSAVDSLKKELIPLATVVTPNIPEAEILSGIKINNEKDIEKAAKVILDLGARAVLMKGGHLPSEDLVTDYLFFKDDLEKIKDKTMIQRTNANTTLAKKASGLTKTTKNHSKDIIKVIKFTHKRINKEGHGTGCTLSSAIAAYLAKDFSFEGSVRKAADYVHEALDKGYKVGSKNYVLKHV